MKDRGYRVIYIDEMCVTRTVIPTHEFSRKHEPLHIDIRQFSKTTLAVIAGISETKGVDIVQCFDRSVNTDKFEDFLQMLRWKYPFDRIALFMDRLSVHTCRRTKDKLRHLGIEPILNASYSPEFNPIESVFAIVKNQIKKERLRKFFQKKEEDLEEMTRTEFKKITVEKCQNFIKHSLI